MPRHVSLGELLTQWWKLPDDLSFVEAIHMTFDELAAVLKIECPDAGQLDIHIYNMDISRKGQTFITFSAGRDDLY